MNRRTFLTGLAGSTAGVTTLAQGTRLAKARGDQQAVAQPTPVATATVQDAQDSLVLDKSLPTIEWQMATSWPSSLDTLYGAAQMVAKRVATMTHGKFTITPHPAGEIAGALDVLNVVREGTIPIGHSAGYYYIDQSTVPAFGTALPFGLTTSEQNAWLYQSGGLAMMQQYYAERFGAIEFPAGNTGAQMGGWFNKQIRTVADLAGLKMRIPGLGGQTWARMGVDVHLLAAEDIFAALYAGTVDAAEFVGPYDDEKLGLYKAAQYYYYPAWWEPCSTLEIEINLKAWNTLPEEYQVIMQMATYEANMMTLARYDVQNPLALQRLFNETDLTLLPFPKEVMLASEEVAFELYAEFAAKDSDFKTVMQDWIKFRDRVQAWHGLAETAYMNYAAWSLETFER